MKKIFKLFLATVLALSMVACATDSTNNGTSNKGLSANAKITGKALYGNSDDATGIIVTLEKSDGVNASAIVSGRGESETQVTTGSDGKYEFKGLKEGNYTVYASSNNSSEKAVYTNVTVARGGTQEVNLQLTATGSISGKVILEDADKTNGSAGFMVFLAGTSYSAMTDKDGNFTISDIPAAANYTVVVSRGKLVYILTDTKTVNAKLTTTIDELKFKSSQINFAGTQGEPGTPGTDGVGIESISGPVSNGLVDTYTITYTDHSVEPTTFTVTNGEKGADGTGTNGASIVWKGELTAAPTNAENLWAYYNTTDGCSYIYDGKKWTLLASKGATGATGGSTSSEGTFIIWKGLSATAPESPKNLWAYYNTTNSITYIYSDAISDWVVLAAGSVTSVTKYSVTIQSIENGTVTADQTKDVIAGTVVTLTIDATTDYELESLTVTYGDDNTVTVTNNKFIMPADNVTVSATFAEITTPANPILTIKISGIYLNGEATSDEVTGDATTDWSTKFTDVTTDVTYDKDNKTYEFKYWEISSAKLTESSDTTTDNLASYKWSTLLSSASNDVTADVKAKYEEVTTEPTDPTDPPATTKYKVTVNATTNGTVTADPSTDVSADTTVTLTINASTGYKLDTLTVTYGEDQSADVSGDGDTRTFKMPAGNVTVNATFKSTDPTDPTDPTTPAAKKKLTISFSGLYKNGSTTAHEEVTGDASTDDWSAKFTDVTTDETYDKESKTYEFKYWEISCAKLPSDATTDKLASYKWGDLLNDASNDVTADAKAVYTEVEVTTTVYYTLTYMIGDTTDATVDVTADVEYTLKEITETKTGYTFSGWYEDKEVSGDAITKVTLSGGHKTVYGKWTANTYKIVFDKNKPSDASTDESGDMTDMNCTYDVSVDLKANTYYLKDYTFRGWVETAEGEVKYTDGQNVKNLADTNNATVTLYAVWTKNVFTMGFIGGTSGSTDGLAGYELKDEDYPDQTRDNTSKDWSNDTVWIKFDSQPNPNTYIWMKFVGSDDKKAAAAFGNTGDLKIGYYYAMTFVGSNNSNQWNYIATKMLDDIRGGSTGKCGNYEGEYTVEVYSFKNEPDNPTSENIDSFGEEGTLIGISKVNVVKSEATKALETNPGFYNGGAGN